MSPVKSNITCRPNIDTEDGRSNSFNEYNEYTTKSSKVVNPPVKFHCC